MKNKAKTKAKIKYGLDDRGRKVHIYSEKEMLKEIAKNQDIVFHKDGWIKSRSVGH